jgi:HK97 gp10 family phage protein
MPASGVRGLARLLAKFDRFPAAAQTEARRAIDAGAEAVLRDMQTFAPRRTGTLVGALESEIAADGLSAKVGIVSEEAQKDAWYARLVEYGTKPHSLAKGALAPRANRRTRAKLQDQGAQHPGAPARPFVAPAFDINRGAIERELAQALARAGAKAGFRRR